MARYLDPYSQGKQDWISYNEKRKQIKVDRQADADHNQKIAERKEQKNKETEK